MTIPLEGVVLQVSVNQLAEEDADRIVRHTEKRGFIG